MPQETSTKKEAPAIIKFLINAGPLIAFFVGYFYANHLAPLFGWAEHPSAQILTATAIFLPTLAFAALLSLIFEGKLPVMHLIGLIMGVFFGGITLWLKDGDFIKMKVTAVYLIFASILGGGLLFRRSLIREVFGEAMQLDETGWRKLTIRWALFFIVGAIANEIIWRTMSENIWVNYKVWGMFILSLLFALSQVPLMQKHQLKVEDASENS